MALPLEYDAFEMIRERSSRGTRAHMDGCWGHARATGACVLDLCRVKVCEGVKWVLGPRNQSRIQAIQ